MELRQSFQNTEFRAIEEKGEKFIEGYFIRFNEETQLWPGAAEEVAPESVVKSLEENDIRALWNHDSGLCLGRSGNNTVKLHADDAGVYGRIEINNNDSQAVDAHARVERGDITGCSFGFNIIEEEIIHREDGTVKFILRDIDLKEISPVTFPAYPTTSVQARKDDYEQHEQRKLENMKSKIKERLENVKTTSATKKD